MSFLVFQFFLPGRGLVLFFLAAPRKLHHRVSSKSLPGTPYYHRTGSPAVSPGQTKLVQTKFARTQTFSAARIFALRDRGLRSISSSDAITGFFVIKRKYLSFDRSRIGFYPSQYACIEKLINTYLPPGF